MGFLVRNGSDEDTPLVGLQSASRLPTIADISVDKDGVAIKVQFVKWRQGVVCVGTESKGCCGVVVPTAGQNELLLQVQGKKQMQLRQAGRL